MNTKNIVFLTFTHVTCSVVFDKIRIYILKLKINTDVAMDVASINPVFEFEDGMTLDLVSMVMEIRSNILLSRTPTNDTYTRRKYLDVLNILLEASGNPVQDLRSMIECALCIATFAKINLNSSTCFCA